MRALLLLAFAFALMGQRDPILVPEVSQHEVQVRQGFTGTELLLFGAVLDPQGRAAGSDYDIVVVLGHNDDPPVPGSGSAIFVHVARANGAPTEGCVAMALPDLLAMLGACSPGDRLCVNLDLP